MIYYETHVLLEWLVPAIALFVAAAVLLSFKKLLWNRLQSLASLSKTDFDDLLLEHLSAPVKVLMVVLAAVIAAQFLPAKVREIPGIHYGLKFAFIAIAAWSLDRFLCRVILGGQKLSATITSGTRQLLQTFLRMVLYASALLVILDTLGISITPVLASLGVGSLAVALALQDTLGNFFSGLYLHFDKPVRAGDFIRLENGSEGEIVKIGWRSTQIRQPNNNIIVIPNTKLSGAILVNYDLENSETGVTVKCSVSYKSDLQKVESIVLEVAREVLARSPSAVSSHTPLVRFTEFGDNGIIFSTVLRASRITEQGLLVHDFIKALHARFAQEKIEIPYPHRVLVKD